MEDHSLELPATAGDHILIPAAFFLSVASPTATQPNGLINLASSSSAACRADPGVVPGQRGPGTTQDWA